MVQRGRTIRELGDHGGLRSWTEVVRDILRVVIKNIGMTAGVHRKPMVVDEGLLCTRWRPDVLVNRIFYRSAWCSWATGGGIPEMLDPREPGYVDI